MILPDKFIVIDGEDYERRAAAAGRPKAFLEAYAAGEMPGPDYPDRRLAGYADSLVAGQRSDGSWSVVLHPERLDPEEQTETWRFPTWCALSILTRLTIHHPALADGKTEKAIGAALAAPAVRDFRFPEAGDAEPVLQVETALILSQGEVPAYLQGHPDTGGALVSALSELTAGFRAALASGNTHLGGGIDYRPLYTAALAGLESPGP